jgi:hypothetical protein
MDSETYTAKLLIFDKSGSLILEQQKEVDINGGDINEIEEAVFNLRKEILPEITRVILESEQASYVKKSPKISY